MKKSNENKQQTEHRSYTKYIISAAIAVIIAALILFVYPFVKGLSYGDRIPALPDMTGQTSAVSLYLQDFHAKAAENPASDEAVGKLAMVFHANFFYELAEETYQLAYELNSSQWRWLYNQALIKEELGDTDGTISLLKQVVEIENNVTPAWFRLGNSYMKSNSFEEANTAFREISNIKEFSPKEYLGFELPNKGAFPYKAYAGLNLGRVAMQQNKLEDAVAILDSTVSEFKTFGPAYRLLSQVYNQMGDEQKGNVFQVLAGDFESYIPPADPMFDALVLYSRNSDFILKQIDLATRSSNFAWAVYLNRIIFDYDPNDGEALTKLIMLSLDLRELSGVESLLKIYHNLYKDDENKLLGMAQYNILRQQPRFALHLLDRVVELNPNSIPAHLEKIKILRLSRRFSEAEEYCNDVLSENPDSYKIRNELGRVLILQEKFADARNQFRRSLRINSENEVALIMMGVLAKKNKDVKSAVDYYKKAVAVNPLNSKTSVALVNYYIELKRWYDAVSLLAKSLKDSPNDNDLLERYAWLLATCPNEGIRNPGMALSIAKRIQVSKKNGPDQEVKAGIALAISHASLGNFKEAVKVCDRYIARAKQIGMQNFIRNLQYFKSEFEKGNAISL